MKEIEMPFLDEFRDVLRQGVKTTTTRTKKMGEPGDRFEAFGCAFQLVAVVRLPLWIVASHFWEPEGLRSFFEFKDIWNKIHPIKGYVRSWEVWLHIFVNLDLIQ